MQTRLLVLLAVIIILLLANLATSAVLVSRQPEVREVEVVKEVVVSPTETPATPSATVTRTQLRVVSPTTAQ